MGAGPKAVGKGWMLDMNGSLAGKEGLAYPQDVIAEKDFQAGKGKVMTVDGTAFKSALMQMYPSYVGMAISLL